MKNPPCGGFFISIGCIYKPNSVPILPTAGGCKIEYPDESFEEGLSFASLQDAQFCTRLWRTTLVAVIYLAPMLPSGSSGTHQSCPPQVVSRLSVLTSLPRKDPSFYSGRSILQLPVVDKIGARPCTEVRILPFQPDLTGSFLLAPLRLLSTGVTRYRSVRLRGPVFGLSSPILPTTGGQDWRNCPMQPPLSYHFLYLSQLLIHYFRKGSGIV